MSELLVKVSRPVAMAMNVLQVLWFLAMTAKKDFPSPGDEEFLLVILLIAAPVSSLAALLLLRSPGSADRDEIAVLKSEVRKAELKKRLRDLREDKAE